VLLLNTLDDSIKSEQDIEENFGIPVIGKISNIAKKDIKMRHYEQSEWKTRGDTVGT
jgi:hypothetical protein